MTVTTTTQPQSNTPRAGPDLRHENGPFDIIGDVHGCADELLDLLDKLGHGVRLEGQESEDKGRARRAVYAGRSTRRIVFVGDFVDRGPNSPDVLRIVMMLVATGRALAVPGNHDAKFRRWLDGRDVKISHGLERTVAQMARESPSFHDAVRRFLDTLPYHLWLDGGRLVVAHAGIEADMIGTESERARSFSLFGDTGGARDSNGISQRFHWAAHYEGEAAVVYGHTPVDTVDWVNNTLCIDTGCCFGGSLTALQWPERLVLHVRARQRYAAALRPFGHPPVRPIST